MNPNRHYILGRSEQDAKECHSRIGNGFGARLMADSGLIEKGGAIGLGRGAPPLF